MSDAPKQMPIPMAIIIAGALIAVAVYFSKVGPSPAPVPAVSPSQIAQQTPGPLPERFDIRAVSSSDHVRGDLNAPVTLIEYSDLECPYCKLAHATVGKVLENYTGKVRVVYRHGESVHQQTIAEANAAECASAQGKFWEFIDTIFANTPSNDGLNLADLPKYARQAGVADVSAFEQCVAKSTYSDIVQADTNEFAAIGKLMDSTGNRIGTPFFIVVGKDGKQIPVIGAQPYSKFQTVIDSLL